MSKEKKVKKSSVFVLMFFTLGSRIFGLLREVTKARYVGDGSLNDAFNLAFTIPNLLRRLFAESSMTVAFIPTFKGYLNEADNTKTKEFINSIFTLLLFLVTATVVVGILSLPLILKLVDTKSANIDELQLLTKIMFPYLIFISIAALLQGVLNSLNIYGPGSFVPILFNIITILSTIYLTKYQIVQNPARAMAVGITLGGFLQMAFQIPYIIKNGYSPRIISPFKAFKNKGTKKVVRLITPTLASMGAYQLNTAVASFVAFNTGEGVSSALVYSLRLQELVLGVFAVSIGTILISTLSRDAKAKDWDSFYTSLKVSLNGITLLTIPVTVYAFIHSEQLVNLVYNYDRFTESGVMMTASVFRYHIAALFFIALSRILAPVFFSLEDSKTPAMLSIISLLIGVPLMFILAPVLKADGIAIATITSSIILMILYFVFLSKKKIVDFNKLLVGLSFTAIKVFIFSIISAIPVLLYKERIISAIKLNSLIMDRALPLVITTILFFTIYIGILLISKEKSVIELKSLARKR